ncbi:hypothetical protein [Prosthecomicrobium hirschii]|uniref:hypothetical protein n=1 Tax=Prosthecodimorpha hirschii TaxID=665126 RepID=UPI00221F5576|nr:hypothetical protein [Prosthecomicrobium hirschii]MCW1839530.1 hypothetical protein [Prosthecomicrobium hirschii]
MWYRHGRLHRENGPAIENSDGSKEFWLDDAEYEVDEYAKKLWPNDTGEQVIFLLKHK